VYPSNAFDAKGLLCRAIQEEDPVIYFEHKYLYRSNSEEVPDDYYELEIGKGRRITEGNEVSIITYGMGVSWAQEWMKNNSDISVDLIDLVSLAPLDKELVISSVKNTGKVIILHEDTLTGGIGAEISAIISSEAFEYLDAPVMRCASLDTPVPFAPALEKGFMANGRFDTLMQKLLDY